MKIPHYFLKYNPDPEFIPYVSLSLCQFIDQSRITKAESTDNILEINGVALKNDVLISKMFVLNESLKLYDENNELESSKIDHYITQSFFIYPYISSERLIKTLDNLNICLYARKFLVIDRLSLADFFVWFYIQKNPNYKNLEKSIKEKFPNYDTWFKNVSEIPEIKNIMFTPKDSIIKRSVKEIKKETQLNQQTKMKKKDEGKFIELRGAQRGKVVVRFPPEASGYLHIGHAKAALLNQYYQQMYDGKLIMRFDDTNPAKETEEYEQEILKDLSLLAIRPDHFSHSSDHFESILQCCEMLINSGHFYVDDTPAEQMRKERDAKIESHHRKNDVSKNLTMWEEMKQGTTYGQTFCVRAKIDMQSNNGCMRDPTMYRCKVENHIRTGDKYKVYPTYDFACPLVDSFEGVTHALRTTEYHDRDEQYDWIYDTLKAVIEAICENDRQFLAKNPTLRVFVANKPIIWEYSRLAMTHTVLSKRKLNWMFSEEGMVQGWDDPRFPTLRGILRRGLTLQGLKDFIIAQGSSKSVVTMEWDKIWSFNKKVIEPTAHRYVALETKDLVSVYVLGVSSEYRDIPLHPKDNSMGSKSVCFSPNIHIEQVDAQCIKQGDIVTFINLGNVLIEGLEHNSQNSNTITAIKGKYMPENKDFKDTLKITWLAMEPDMAKTDVSSFIPIKLIYLDYLITKPVLGKDEDFKQYINRNPTWMEINYLGEAGMANIGHRQIIQIVRKGFFICDRPFNQFDASICRTNLPLRLIAIPDGSTTANPFTNIFKLTTHSKTESIAKTENMNEKSESIPLEVDEMNKEILKVGNLIRDLKAKKTEKIVINEHVQKLLDLKAKYKQIINKDWAPMNQTVKKPIIESESLIISGDLDKEITKQGDLIRDLKSKKADKKLIDENVQLLLKLKNEYKLKMGTDWTPNNTVKSQDIKNDPIKTVTNENVPDLNEKIRQQGDLIRTLKSQKAEKKIIDENVKILLELKGEYKMATGTDWTPKPA